MVLLELELLKAHHQPHLVPSQVYSITTHEEIFLIIAHPFIDHDQCIGRLFTSKQ